MRIEQIKRETEKALLLTVEVENCAGRKAIDFWFPRSQVTVNGSEFSAPEWLVRAKLIERFGDNIGQASWIN